MAVTHIYVQSKSGYFDRKVGSVKLGFSPMATLLKNFKFRGTLTELDRAGNASLLVSDRSEKNLQALKKTLKKAGL